MSIEAIPLAIGIVGMIVGVLIAVAGALAPSLSEFMDRPLCWLFGHRPDRYLYPTIHNGQPAQVWRCARGHDPVTYVEAPHAR